LTGELRAVQNAEKIVREAIRMGFSKVILPKRNADKIAGILGTDIGLTLVGVQHLTDAIRAF
jgi:DNA repair protein RadA/Sms